MKIRDNNSISEHLECIADLLAHDKVREMNNYIQHGSVTCLEHCINVSYYSFLICKRMRLNYKSAARAALLHDLFLYDWHSQNPHKGLHGFNHPKIALKNALKYFLLSEKECEIIKKHMWPLTLVLPKYMESYVVLMVDKYCAIKEFLSNRLLRLRKRKV